MASQLNELDSDALLVLYLAGELANGEKAALERRLAGEPALAAELQRLREAQAFCVDTLKAVDEQGRLPVSEGVAVRRVSRAMQQWHVDRVRAAPSSRKKGLPLPWWSYPVAAAASIIIAFLVWSSRQPLTNELKPDVPLVNQDSDSNEDQPATNLADWMDSSFGVTAEANADESGGIPAGLDDAGSSMFPTREETLQ
jgi:anti-sigma factor RsiW